MRFYFEQISSPSKVLLLKDVEFKAEGIIKISGKNGIGKTTLLNKLFERYYYVSSYCTQEIMLLDNLSIKDNIKLLNPKFEQSEFEQKLKISSLSGGQKKILHLKISLNKQSDIYIIDEPFNYLSKNRREEVIEIIKNLNGVVIFTDHFNILPFDTEVNLNDFIV